MQPVRVHQLTLQPVRVQPVRVRVRVQPVRVRFHSFPGSSETDSEVEAMCRGSLRGSEVLLAVQYTSSPKVLLPSSYCKLMAWGGPQRGTPLANWEDHAMY